MSDPVFLRDVVQGLSHRPRSIPPRWFYDATGSELFEAITRTSEYYPTRTETVILQGIGDELFQATGAGRAVVEFGSGSATKTPLVLRGTAPAAYVPIDISSSALQASVAALRQVFHDLPILPIETDFLRPFSLPPRIAALPKLGFFPGSTIGNMVPEAATDLLRSMRKALGAGALLLIGMDQIKDRDVLLRAYDDAQGVTARFNLNLLDRINRELAGDIPVDAFVHHALWNENDARIEMHLEATRPVRFNIGSAGFAMELGETIHTENSHKYGSRDARKLLASGGWRPLREWTDPDEMFSVFLAEGAPCLLNSRKRKGAVRISFPS